MNNRICVFQLELGQEGVNQDISDIYYNKPSISIYYILYIFTQYHNIYNPSTGNTHISYGASEIHQDWEEDEDSSARDQEGVGERNQADWMRWYRKPNIFKIVCIILRRVLMDKGLRVLGFSNCAI